MEDYSIIPMHGQYALTLNSKLLKVFNSKVKAEMYRDTYQVGGETNEGINTNQQENDNDGNE